jgi:type VI protein secretion system component Hcp
MAAFIHFSNKVEGPCEKFEHEGWIEMESWSWSCAREMSGGNQVGWASGVAKFEVLEFTAPIGSATIAMFMKMLNGTHFDNVLIHGTKNTGKDEPEVWMDLRLDHVLVTSISQEIGEDEATDTIALTFSQLHMLVSDQDAEGKLEAPKEFKYDVTVAKIK